MKTKYILIFLILITFTIMFSCASPTVKTNNDSNGKKITTIISPNNYDTLADTLSLKMFMKNYMPYVSNFCLNDTGISIVIEDDTSITTFLYHNYAFNLKLDLKRKNKNVFDTTITKFIFKDSLDATFYKTAVLSELKYEFVRSNKMYFKTFFSSIDSTEFAEAEMAIYYKTDKVGEINFWGFKDSTHK